MVGLKPVLIKERAEEAARWKPKAARKVRDKHNYFPVPRDWL
jgi:hypothetical protein